jgi:hypothetical protein
MRTGSLINRIADNAVDAQTPEVGLGATVVLWSDRKAATILSISPTGHRIVVQYDIATRTDQNGMSDSQSYRYERDTDGRIEEFTRRKDGSYRIVGGDSRLLVGVRDHYHDYSF